VAAIVVTGAGVSGLIGAMLLANDGHDVTVVERDPGAPPSPGDAWESWERRGVNQFRLLHFFLPRFRAELERELPQVIKALDEAGALRFNPLASIPEDMKGPARPGDDDFEGVTGRRPVVEAVVAAAAEATPGIDVRRGVAVEALCTGRSAVPGVPHVTGVRTDAGDELQADLVVDATGRRSPLPAWLEAIGARRPDEELEDSGFVYYGRHFRSADGSVPPAMGPLLQPYGSLSVLTLPADNGTWGVGLIASNADKAMRVLKDDTAWAAVLASLPLAAHWGEGEPLEDRVTVMAKIEDRHRSFLVDGAPVATGVAALADSWACTNPSLGRGASMAVVHSLALRDTLRASDASDPAAFQRSWSEATDASVEPWYRATVQFDRHRLAEIDAIIKGDTYAPDGPEWDMIQALNFAAGQDGDCLRALLSLFGLQRSPEQVLGAPGVFDKVISLGGGWRDAPRLGPDRAELLSIVAGRAPV
jgi:2-polyprenyl-6-methoxyphenol hydroxylase-like FAD-dependent oxidoreductase